MDMEEIQSSNSTRFSRPCNGGGAAASGKPDPNAIGQKGGDQVEEDGETRRGGGGTGTRPSGGGGIFTSLPGNDGGGGGASARIRGGWPQNSRIIRVSRTSGGKDRHSKVWTSRGLRDRRIRLSVTTAIQFYDLQDRLGYDQPSKAVEWLIKAAADPIADLPSLNHSFPNTPNQLSDEKRPQIFDSSDALEGSSEGGNFHRQPLQQQQQQQLSLSKSACSSTSDTSKSSGLSLSRTVTQARAAARARAKERATKDKEIDSATTAAAAGHHHHHQQGMSPISPNASSFTELLAGGLVGLSAGTGPAAAAARQWPSASAHMDYINAGGHFAPRAHHSSGFSGQTQLGNSLSQSSTIPAAFSVGGGGDGHPELLQHFPLVPDHLIPVTAQTQSSGSEYNLNFTIASGGLSAGISRGTLQSNFPSMWPHIQRFSSADGPVSNLPLFIGAAAPMESHPQFPPGLQLCYGDGSRLSDQKGKGKN